MKIRFVGERPRDVATPGLHLTVHPGGEYEVPDRTGSAMCEQKWFEPVDQAVNESAATDEPVEPESAVNERQKPARASRKESTP